MHLSGDPGATVPLAAQCLPKTVRWETATEPIVATSSYSLPPTDEKIPAAPGTIQVTLKGAGTFGANESVPPFNPDQV